jgi:hypothetical protein
MMSDFYTNMTGGLTMNESFIRFAGWSSYANAALTIAILVTLAVFFAIGGPWGTINDALSVVWALSFIPLMIVLYQLNRPANATFSLALAIVGIAAMGTFAFLQTLLVLRLVQFEQTFMAVVTLGGIMGLALLLDGLLARSSQSLPAGLTWLMVAFGLGYIISVTGFWLGGWENPLASIGYLIGILTGPAWAIWLGRLLLNGFWTTAMNSVGG